METVEQTETVDETRQFWDTDAETYDRSPSHHPTTALERASWTAVLARLLPPPPARVLDVGAGTGFLSLLAAQLGHRVTALDLSVEMLERLRGRGGGAGAEGGDSQRSRRRGPARRV
jgi:ubiquinone/menaquinone biosynthesis C-methylase UbiE